MIKLIRQASPYPPRNHEPRSSSAALARRFARGLRPEGPRL